MCAAARDGVTRNLAQKIAGKNRGEHLRRRHWQQFAAECGLNAPRLVKRVEELANSVLREVWGAAEEVHAMPAGTHALMPAFGEAIETRARAIIAGLREEEQKPTPH
jgi:serine/threonine-protein kinase HipA